LDVSKSQLDIASGSNGSLQQIDNDRESILQWIGELSKHVQTLVVVEATGGYEVLLVDLLHESTIAVAVINPRRIRDFTKGVGVDAKTDPIDAKLIAYHGEVVKPQPHVANSDAEKKLEALVIFVIGTVFDRHVIACGSAGPCRSTSNVV